MQPNYPQQGYGGPQQQPYGEPERPRANAGAAILAGLLGLISAAGLIWTVVEYFTEGTPVDAFPTEVWIAVIIRGVLALLLLVVAGMTMARRIGAAWTLVILGLLAAATLILEPLVFGGDIGFWVEAVFEFGDTMPIAIVVAAGGGLLAAIFALFAGALKSGGQQQPEDF